MRRRIYFALLACVIAPASWAGSNSTPSAESSPTPAPDKSQYNLFHPTPDNLLRSFSVDRPSQSTGPYTVDAGHFYFEASALSYLFDQPNDGGSERRWNVLPFNFRVGLTNNVELDLAYGSYVHLRLHDPGAPAQTRDGFGDLVVQSKINLLGNDGGKVAFGLIPFLKIPTNTNGLGNNSIEGGLGLPLQFTLAAGFALGFETGADFVRNDADTGYDAAFVNAVVVSHALFTDKLSGYAEFYSVVTAGPGSSNAAFIDAGVVYQILPNAEIDCGCNFGITDAAPDYQPFVGFGFRF